MADFHQPRHLATFHDLGQPAREWEPSARGTALIIPAHGDDLEGPALRAMMEALLANPPVARIVLSVNRAGADQLARADKSFLRSPLPVTILWADDPAIAAWSQDVGAPVAGGKGRNVWLALGCLALQGETEFVALHDADILGYRAAVVRRLLFPVVQFGYEVCKGYHARVTDRLHGRAQRLLFTPLLWALSDLLPEASPERVLGDLRYPLAGECAFQLEQALSWRLAPGWGLEVSMLIEAASKPERVCQVDIGLNYEHKHQPLDSLADGAGEIVAPLLKTLHWPEKRWPEVERGFSRHAREVLQRYEREAKLNGLLWVKEDEERAVEAFLASLRQWMRAPFDERLPSWREILTKHPSALEDLARVVDRQA